MWALRWPLAQTKGPKVDTAEGNFAFAGAPAAGAWGNAFRLGVATRFINQAAPLQYPKGEQDLLGTVGTQAYAAPALVYTRGQYGTLPLSQQPLSVMTSQLPWEEGPELNLSGAAQNTGL